MIMSGSKQREGLVADQVARAPHRMTEAKRHLLTREAGLPGRRLQALQAGELVVLAALRQRVVELEMDVEMIFDDRLVAASDEDEMLDAGLARLVDHILDHRLVDDRQHLLGDGLGRGQETRAQTGDRKHRLADFSHADSIPLSGAATRSSTPFRPTFSRRN